MIRRIQKKDVEKIAEIWLNTNLKAHDRSEERRVGKEC